MRLRILWNIPFVVLMIPALILGMLGMWLLSLACWCEEQSLPKEEAAPVPEPFYK